MKAAGWLNGLWTLGVAGGLLAASCATQLDRHKATLVEPQPPTLHTQSPIPQAKLQVTYAHLPLHFEPNQGQTDERVHFLSRGRGYTLFLTSTEAVLTLQNPEARIQKSESQHPTPNTQPPAVLRLQFVGANPNPQIAGHEALPGQVNYFIGSDSEKWRTNIPTFAKVQYQDVYPGVDLLYYGNQQQLEFDFVVAPGTDPKTIRLTFDGLVGAGLVPAQDGDGLVGAGLVPAQDGRPQGSPLQIADNGDLIVSVAGGEVRLRKPLIYQEIDGVRQPISGHYVIIESEISSPLIPNPQSLTPKVGFQIASYDTTKPLIIDPVLSYSTYLGGNSRDYVTAPALAPDGSGGVWVAGSTESTNFPTAEGGSGDPGDGFGYDAFVSHFTASGVLTYSTYLGGNSFFYDAAFALAPDGSGGVWVAGYTGSTDFPTQNPFQPTLAGSVGAFVSHFTASGALTFSTYLGGNNGEYAYALAPDGSGGVWVGGITYSTDFPTAGGGTGDPGDSGYGNAFVSHFTASGALTFSTYLGGNGDEYVHALAPDGSGGVWVTAYTRSTNFPTAGGGTGGLGGYSDAFVSHFTASGALTFSTYLGGNSSDAASALAPDGSGGVWVLGHTSSTNFPTAGGGSGDPGDGFGQNAFVSHFTASGTLTFSTYLGGNGDEYDFDYASALAPDGGGGVWVAGLAASTDFPTQNPFQPTLAGSIDAFVSHFAASGALTYSTYLGGNGQDFASALAPDGSGGVWVAGDTRSTNFPTAGGGSGDPGDSEADAFVSHFTASGVLTYSTYLGGNNYAGARALAPDGSGGVWVAGGTTSTNFPTVNPFQAANAGGGDAFVARISGSLSSSPQTHVVLVHGFLGSPSSFGQMKSLLVSEGGYNADDVLEYDYGVFNSCSAASDSTIEFLAAQFSAFLKDKLHSYPPGTQVDVIAHSMGGLIVRAYMAGMAQLPHESALPYGGEIRRLILAGTPSYGADAEKLGSLVKTACFKPGSAKGLEAQLEEMEYGSRFLWDLDRKWLAQPPTAPEDILAIAGTAAGFGDGAVRAASVALPANFSLPDGHVLYVPYRHCDYTIGPVDICAPLNLTQPALVNVQGAEHLTFKIVEAFLLSGQPPTQKELGYEPTDRILDSSLLLLRMVDKLTEKPIVRPPRVRIKCLFKISPPIYENPVLNNNKDAGNEAGTVTVPRIEASLWSCSIEVVKTVRKTKKYPLTTLRSPDDFFLAPGLPNVFPIELTPR
ncbi:MAG: hypothetical protein HYZ50_04225 [Deltaproteobacteria bacterium]|nr:hypothetical protein [Deltaproteobacteria bacterium]